LGLSLQGEVADMRGHRWIASLLALAASAMIAVAQAPDTTALVRLSYVQGGVKVLQHDQLLFDQAQANMPLFSGYALSTGEDGQAEVEFLDGSVARVTPNSELRLDRVASADNPGEPTELTMVSGLGYFELNTANGQKFSVHFNAGLARPVSNSIFRIDLDHTPDLAVFTGTVRASADGAFDQTVEEGGSLQFDANDVSNVTTAAIQSDSWDQWNQDRDNQIAQEAEQQTSAREASGAANEPGWDDLDNYGDWYPVEGYGNVWVPDDQPAGWDPYGYGYWANYPGWGYTWISGYPWGWLPYHCGAWNYWDGLGWGWIPGQCGLGWQPIITVWNAPHGWRQPPRPIPGGHIGPPSRDKNVVAVNRGPVLSAHPGVNRNNHTQPVRIDGQRVDPLPVLGNPTLGGRYGVGGHTTVEPSRPTYGFQGNGGNAVRPTLPRMQNPTTGVTPVNPRPPSVITTQRPVFQPQRPVPQPSPTRIAPPQRITPPSPAPRVQPMPRVYSPPPAPRMSSPAPPTMSAPHPGGGGSAGHH
jgi:hypothetical protein